MGSHLIHTYTPLHSFFSQIESIHDILHTLHCIMHCAVLHRTHRSHALCAEEGDKAVTSASTTSGKSRLANGESDTAAYLTPQGLSRDCWARLGEHVKAVFGAADVAEEKESVEEYETGSTEKKVKYCHSRY